MNKLTVMLLGVTVAIGATFHVIAQTELPQPAKQFLVGTVTSTEQPEITVQFPKNKAQIYNLDAALVKSMKLTQGSTVNIDYSKLGTIINVDRDSVKVEFADDKIEAYFLHQEGRATLSVGDRIVVTPDQRLARAENYVLTAADVRMPMSMTVNTSANSGTVNQNTSSNMPTTPPESSLAPDSSTTPNPTP
ncbi:MAG: hypothetical protein WCD18_07995 [Thermosynechococcaceae cyanobacterium]